MKRWLLSLLFLCIQSFAEAAEKPNIDRLAREEVVTRQTEQMQKFIAEGRSTPGVSQKNAFNLTLEAEKITNKKRKSANQPKQALDKND
jgi:hypothetical protein